MQLPDGVVSNFINVNGLRTHFVEAGHGDPVILVHGGGPGAFGWAGWRETIPALAKHFHVYALDTLGFGLTDKPTDIVYSDQASVNHLAGFIDALCLDKVSLIGNSKGAYMAAKYMLDFPHNVRRLIMISSGTIAVAMGLDWSNRRTDGRKRIQAYDGTPESMRKFLEVIVHDHSKIDDALVNERVKMAALPGHDYVKKSQTAYQNALKENPNERQLFSVRHRLPEVTIPMLMIWGEQDSFAPPEFADELRGVLPNVQFIMMKNSGHQVQNDESKRFNDIAINFFAAAEDSHAVDEALSAA